MKIDLSALGALQKPKPKSAKEKLNAPAKTLVERATANVATAAKATTEPAPVSAKSIDVGTKISSAETTEPSATTDKPSPSPVNSTHDADAAGLNSDTVPADDVAAFAQSLQDLEQLIDADNPIRDATMEMIARCQAAPHLSDFLYENEDAFAIGLRALRKLVSQRTEKRGEYRAKQQKKSENVNTFMADLQDLKL